MGGSDNEVKLGNGKGPDGAAVSYYEVDRPGTIGAKGAQGFVVEVRGADGKRITHSDSLDGLKKAGYILIAEPVEVPVQVPAPVVVPEPVPAAEKSIEDELS